MCEWCDRMRKLLLSWMPPVAGGPRVWFCSWLQWSFASFSNKVRHTSQETQCLFCSKTGTTKRVLIKSLDLSEALTCTRVVGCRVRITSYLLESFLHKPKRRNSFHHDAGVSTVLDGRLEHRDQGALWLADLPSADHFSVDYLQFELWTRRLCNSITFDTQTPIKT